MNKVNNYVFTYQDKTMENNSYIITNDDKECYIIDPSWNATELIGFIEVNGLKYLVTILTHLHYDHVFGIKEICDYFHNNLIYCSSLARQIINEGKNEIFFGEYLDRKAYDFKLLTENDKILGFNNIQFVQVPGHSECSMIINYQNCIFTGDFILGSTIGRTDLQFSDVTKMNQSITKFKKYMKNKSLDMMILPGHGYLNTWEFFKKTNIFFN